MTRKKLPLSLRIKICDRQNWLCACCAKPFHFLNEIEIDHWNALVHGGKDTPDNLRALLKSCHKRKTAKDVKANAKVKRLRRGRQNAKQRALKRIEDWRLLP